MNTETAVAVAAATPNKLSQLGDWFTPDVIRLLQMAPLNETVRGIVMAKVKSPVPVDLTTFDQIKDWIESKSLPKPEPEDDAESEPEGAPPDRRFFVDVNFKESVSGKCDFYSTASAGCRYSFGVDDILEYLNRPDNTAQDIVEALNDHVHDNAWEDLDPDMEVDTDDATYDEHEIRHTSDRETEVPRHRLILGLRNWILRNAAQHPRAGVLILELERMGRDE